MLQERGMETFVKTVGVLQAHTNYFATTDASYFILMKIHNVRIFLRWPIQRRDTFTNQYFHNTQVILNLHLALS